MCGPQERVSDAAVNGMHRLDNPLNLELHCPNELDEYWEVGNLLEEVEEQNHNMWNEGLSLITGINTGPLIQSCLSDEELGRVAISSHFAVDCLSCVNSEMVREGPENKDGPLHKFTRQGGMHARPHTIGKERALPTWFQGRQNATVAEWNRGRNDFTTEPR